MIKSKNKIGKLFCIQICGGLGNQMFQYAFAKSISVRYNIPFIMDCQYFEAKDIPQFLEFKLDVFDIDLHIANGLELRRFRDPFFISFINKIARFYNLPNFLKSNNINEVRFNNSIVNDTFNFDNCYLTGYWQSENYFKSIEQFITNDFEFKTPLDNKNIQFKKIMEMTNSISIHIRRGDYISNASASKNHGTCSIEYYRSAINLINIEVDNPIFFIFSDDFDWIKQNDFGISNYHLIDWNRGEKSYCDMRMMSYCSHNIIANSTFSWWGAWLNRNPDKIVISPRKWFADVRRKDDSNKIIPNNWRKI
jgi:hypothetical protein